MEDAAQEVWVISPYLHYDVNDADFSEIVSVNLGQKTKYKYIVPATKTVLKNVEAYQKKYKVKDAEIERNFLILPENDFIPFILEIAIYNANSECVACAAPSLEGGTEVIRFTNQTATDMADQFRHIWKKYKREKI